MQNSKQPRSISQILGSVKANSDQFEVIELAKGVLVEVRAFQHKTLGLVPKYKLVIESTGFTLEFQHSAKKWKENNGCENETTFGLSVMAAFPNLFPATITKPNL